MKIEFNEIGMIEIVDFYEQVLNDITNFTESVYSLDFSEIEVLSLPAIQVLLSLKKYCDSKNIKLECINIESDNIKQSLTIYNLNEILGVK